MPDSLISPKGKANKLLPLIMFFCLLPQSLLAQTGPAVMVDVSSCLQLESVLERYDCYENQANAAIANNSADTEEQAESLPNTITEPASISSQPPLPTPAVIIELTSPVRVTEENFGLAEEPEVETEPENEDVAELTSVISELRERLPNSHIITLENGQVWRQMTSERYRLRIGQQVRIYPTRWGSAYRLAVAELGGFIQIERIK